MLSVLAVHNHYRQPGGEDRVFAEEAALLDCHGHSVTRYEDHNRCISKGGLGALSATVWSAPSYRRLKSLLRERTCGIAHFHNTFPLISPAAYFAARNAGLPVVQTLHNYRLICPAATLLRNGSACEECIQRQSFLPAVVHGCYRNSRPATAAVATMLTVHRAAGTWERMVDMYIALSDFARRKFI